MGICLLGLAEKTDGALAIIGKDPVPLLNGHFADDTDPLLLFQIAMLFEALDPISDRCLGLAKEKGDVLDVDAEEVDGVEGVVLDLNGRVALDDLLENVHCGGKKGENDGKEGIAFSHEGLIWMY